MKRRLILPLLILSLIGNAFFLVREFGVFHQTQDEEEMKVTAVRVIDGDTFDTSKDERVRLKGAEAPEYPKGCLSEEAKTRLEELVLGERVLLKKIKKDSFGRRVAFAFVEGLFVDQSLIEEGLAKAASGEDPEYGVKLLGAEDSAGKAKRGIWSIACVPQKPECNIKGNVRTDKGTKIYHLPGCFNYERINLKEREGDRWFCSEEEAKRAGFRKAEDCPE